ncbi:heterokaryon incompatibility protein-domain-containing protein [Stachybotrys elegans]|uniref:Heterokaryon incompatibility protein-domain-containing protein n=1 Tax=Stachybotrys elegans TaxID=80388 RepID=A0A8K0SKX3_9HYPO|nr:heterokaryon incompatibility protein-domain-containing protein [Stachybotrys elegans]
MSMSSLHSNKLWTWIRQLATLPLLTVTHLPVATIKIANGWILHLRHLVGGFKYRESLEGKQIRLLKLPQDATSSVLKLGIETYPVHECPPFIALSYTWNDPSALNRPYTWLEMQSLYIDGRLFLVRPNIHHALKRLAQLRPEQYVWADAVCINQSDATEQPQQLDLMDLIYTEAQETVIWLGENTAQTQKAIEIVTKISTEAEAKVLDWSRNQTYGNAFFPDDKDLLRLNGLPPLSSEDWESMGDIFERRWFGRVWMIQELALSRQTTLLIGGYELPYRVVGDAALLLAMSNAAIGLLSTEKAKERVSLARGIVVAFGLQVIREWSLGDSSKYQEVLEGTDFSVGITAVSPTQSLVSLISASLDFLSSKPLDKVYGLLGLVNHISRIQGREPPNIHPPRRPDLGCWERTKEFLAQQLRLIKSPDKEAEEYMRLATILFTETNSLNLLSLAGDGATPSKNTPSWIPVFSPVHSPLLRPNYTSIEPFNASGYQLPEGGSEVASMIDSNTGRLTVRCVDLGPVNDFGDTLVDMTHGKFDLCCRLLLQCGPIYAPTQQPVVEAFWRTLVMDQDMTTRPAPALVLQKSFSDYMKAAAFLSVCKGLTKGGVGRPFVDVVRDYDPRFILATKDTTGCLPQSNFILQEILKLQDLLKLQPDSSSDQVTLLKLQPDSSSEEVVRYKKLDEWVKGGAAFESQMRLALAPNRRLFRTLNGRIGLSTPGAQVGDRVFIIEGCSIPLMVRRVESVGEACYKLIGGVYVHGVMNGEAVAGLAHDYWATITFV